MCIRDSDNPVFEEIRGFFSPSNTTLLFFTTSESNIYSVPNDGNGPAINLSNGLETIGFFSLSEDRKIIAFFALVEGQTQLFSTNTDGSSNPVLITELSQNINTDFFNPNLTRQSFSLDGSLIFYTVESTLFNGDIVTQLFSVPSDGSLPPTPLSDQLEGDIDFITSEDGKYIAFTNQSFFNVETSLYIAPVDRSSESILVDSGDTIHRFNDFDNGQFLVYSITEPVPGTTSTHSVIKSIPFNSHRTESPVIISETNNGVGLNIDTRTNFEVSSDGKFVFYIDDSMPTKLINRASIDNSTPIINVIGEKNGLRGLRDSDLVIVDDKLFFIGFSFVSGVALNDQLFSTSFDGSEVVQISPTFNNNGEPLITTDFDISNDGQFAVFTSINDFTDETTLFSAQLEKENDPLCFPIKSQNDNFVTICL